MNKQDVINALAEATGMTKVDSGKALDAFMEVITNALVKGEKVTLTGFGTFEPRHVAAKMGRNIRTKAPIKIPARRRPAFKAGKTLKDALKS